MPDLSTIREKWAMREREARHAYGACKAALDRARTPEERGGLQFGVAGQKLRADFWRGMIDRLDACPHLLPEAAIAQSIRHGMLRDLWDVVREDLREAAGA